MRLSLPCDNHAMRLSSDVCKACISAKPVVPHMLLKKALQLFTSMPASHRLAEADAESLAGFSIPKNQFGQCAHD